MANNSVLYGFANLEYLFAQRIVDVSVQTVQDAVFQSLEEYNRQINGLMGSLVQRTTDYKRLYQLASAGTLQPLDANGNPLPVMPSGKYDVAFPIEGAGTAWGTDRISRAKMTVGDANRFTADALTKDADWLRRHILAALFTNVTYAFADEAYGSLIISTLANGGTETFVRKSGAASIDDHFLAQANAIGNGADNPYPIIYTELDEHPSNRGPYVVYIPTASVATTQGLSTFRDVNDSSVLFADNVSLANMTFDKNVTSQNQFTMGIGDRVVGYDSGCIIIEWSALPTGYMIGHASGSANDVLQMREHPELELQGFFPELQNVDGNHLVNRFLRFAGFGVQNKIGALIYRIGNASYAIPSGYAAPLSV